MKVLANWIGLAGVLLLLYGSIVALSQPTLTSADYLAISVSLMAIANVIKEYPGG